MMNIFKSIKNQNNLFLNVLFSLIPLGFIVGNSFLNTNIILLILFSLIFFKKKIFDIKINFLDKLICVYFAYTILVALIHLLESYWLKLENFNVEIIYKTFFYLRYFLLYFTIRYLVEKDLINFKWFFITSTFFCLFVSFDIIFQFFFKRDIFGYEIINIRKLAGPFGEELIAGGYIQRFFLFFIYLFSNHFSKKKLNYYSLVFSIIIFTGILLSGNRIPFVLLVITVLLLIFFDKKIRIKMILFLTIGFFTFLSLLNNFQVKVNYQAFLFQAEKLINISLSLNDTIESKRADRLKLPEHFNEFQTFYGTWLMNKYTGGGIRSFRFNCPNREYRSLNERDECNIHPHNYYLEVLTDLGLIGLIILCVLFSSIFYATFVKKYFFKTRFVESDTITPFIFIFIAEVFPLKSTGSFFTTSNSVFLFLIISILVSLSQKKIRE